MKEAARFSVTSKEKKQQNGFKPQMMMMMMMHQLDPVRIPGGGRVFLLLRNF
jgi:hypothetical protein